MADVDLSDSGLEPGSLAALLTGAGSGAAQPAAEPRVLDPTPHAEAAQADELRVLREEIDALRREVIDLRERLAASGERMSAARYLDNEHVVALREKLATLRQLVAGR
jgi:hypothetical protein